MPSKREILELLRHIRECVDAGGTLSLGDLAERAGWSPFHVHRKFRAVTGETPKQYTQRLRLERAAARLLTGTEPIVTIAAAAGFASHEVFTRAFRRHFECTPAQYRAHARRRVPSPARHSHVDVTVRSGPCIGLFHLPDHHRGRRRMSMLSIERRELETQPTLSVRLSAARHELSKAIGEGVGKVYSYAQRAAVGLAGHPYTRYLSVGPGLLTIEVGFRVSSAATGEGEIAAGHLPAGTAVVAVHGGPYDQLSETYAAAERWMVENGLRPAGAPWEWYATDPAEHPDPADWRTNVYWPVARAEPPR